MSNIVPPIPTFRIKTSEYNTSNLRDLAASLFQAITSICSSGAAIGVLQVNVLNANTLNASGASFVNLTVGSLVVTGATVTNLTATNQVVTNLTGTNLFVTNETITSLTGTNIFVTGATVGGILTINGLIEGHVNTTGGNYTASVSNYAILFTGAGPNTLTLPAASSVPGITYKVFNDMAGALSFTLNGSDKYLGTGASIFSLTGHSATILTSDGIASWWNV
jgi:hypothetical protein